MHFFLHGWSASPDTEKNKKFFQVTTTYGNKILILPFSEWTEKEILFDKNTEDEFFDKWKNIFIRYNTDKDLKFECASRDILKLIEQIKNNDILFFCGWKTQKHLEIMNKIENLKELLKDKIIMGNSAWSIMWTKTYYHTKTEEIKEWNGRLNIKMMVHRWANRHSWLSDEERLKILEEHGEKLPIYKIPEQEYIEFTI